MPISYEEKLAKLAIERALPGSELLYREHQSHGEYDFELRHNDIVAAVEVTAAVNQALEEVSAAIRNRRRGGNVFAAAQCRQSWMIFPVPSARINNIRAQADSYLAEIEAAGITRFRWPRDDHPGVARIFHDLGVVSGSVLNLNDERPWIRISAPTTGSAYGAPLVKAALEREAAKKDNRAKLGASAKAQRHLAVHVPIQNGGVWCALVDFGPPSALPDLPAEITDIWVYSPQWPGQNRPFVAT